MRTSLSLLAAALLVLAGCDSTERKTTNSSTGSTKVTVNKPAYSDNTTDAGTSDVPGVNSAAKPGTSLAPASTDKTGTAGPSSAVEPDNTAVNERDRDPNAKTPFDQNENQRDINITAEIRKAVLAHENLSLNADNVKIITADGKVTLRGPVNSQEEKDVVDTISKDVAGKDNVTNEIEVKDSK